MAARTEFVLAPNQLTRLIEALAGRGYEVIGPVPRDGAVLLDRVRSVGDLPAGWSDEQAPGRYRLKRRPDEMLFGFSLGPQSWKKYFHPAELRLWSAERSGQEFRIVEDDRPPAHPYALLGVRPCELAAIEAQDRVLLGASCQDPVYRSHRERAFIVAVQCTQAAATCFCASLGTGPRAYAGFDLALTELPDPHRFLLQTGSRRGAELAADLETTAPSTADHDAAAESTHQAAHQQRSLDTLGLHDLLERNFDHPRWDEIAARCLACGNCTMACPTCFCTTVEDATDIPGGRAERWRRWDSCFTSSFSYIHGGSIRASTKARYRQWLTHKLASWVDQFGGLGCVGCGRCITWCPAGIDLTREIAAIRETANHGNT